MVPWYFGWTWSIDSDFLIKSLTLVIISIYAQRTNVIFVHAKPYDNINAVLLDLKLT